MVQIFSDFETEAAIERNPSCGDSWDGVATEIAKMRQEAQEREARGEPRYVVVREYRSNRRPAIPQTKK